MSENDSKQQFAASIEFRGEKEGSRPRERLLWMGNCRGTVEVFVTDKGEIILKRDGDGCGRSDGERKVLMTMTPLDDKFIAGIVAGMTLDIAKTVSPTCALDAEAKGVPLPTWKPELPTCNREQAVCVRGGDHYVVQTPGGWYCDQEGDCKYKGIGAKFERPWVKVGCFTGAERGYPDEAEMLIIETAQDHITIHQDGDISVEKRKKEAIE